jgi:ABC-type dipeptide/oligopeptide/nickel transport system permease subunit
VQPPKPSLGTISMNAQINFTVAPWIPIASSAAVAVVLMALYAIGDELRERDRLSAAISEPAAHR